jgi:competence protein ComEA
MDKLQPWMRWLAVTAAAGALAFAFFSPHRPETTASPDGSTPPTATNATPVDSPSPSQLAVYVCGAVRKAGVFRLAQGSRVVDAIGAAGGLAGDADPESINLAEPLVDGMKVEVPKKGSEATYFRSISGVGSHRSSSHRSPSRHQGGSGRSGTHKLQPGQTIDINTAGEAELIQLPGVGPGLARRIVKYREENGPFQLVDDLQNVSGIGPSKFAKLETYVRL